jgi:hypothetical protein
MNDAFCYDTKVRFWQVDHIVEISDGLCSNKEAQGSSAQHV